MYAECRIGKSRRTRAVFGAIDAERGVYRTDERRLVGFVHQAKWWNHAGLRCDAANATTYGTRCWIGLYRTRARDMAKYRHRIFEMYEFRDEAIRALTPKTTCLAKEPATNETWTLPHFVVSRSAGVTHVEFKKAKTPVKDTGNNLRKDLSKLADSLVIDSKVLLDFDGIKSFCADSIAELVLFNQKLRTKGSRVALCCLEPAVRESFFAGRIS